MPTKYFRVRATDKAPDFQPTEYVPQAGIWVGVCETDSEEVISALEGRGCQQISKEEFDFELKKKDRNQFGYHKLVEPQTALQAARPAEKVQQDNTAEQSAATKQPPIEAVIEPKKIPRRGRPRTVISGDSGVADTSSLYPSATDSPEPDLPTETPE